MRAGHRAVQFMFATGIEGSYPTVPGRDGSVRRVDQFAASGHYERWREDFALVQRLGIDHLRYGPPLVPRARRRPAAMTGRSPTRRSPSCSGWGSRRSRTCAISAFPTGSASFQNDDWPEYFAEYARAFARRFPWVRFYTPVNEIFIAALVLGAVRLVERARAGDRSFVNALKQPVSSEPAGDARDPRGAPGRGLHPERVVGILSCRDPDVRRPPDSQREAISCRWISRTAIRST